MTSQQPIPTSQLIMQYPITLPSDYDMNIIRDRVRQRGHLLDDRASLICKAYCIREVGVNKSTVNQYSPFYLWGDASAAANFLWHGTGFDGIVRDFGRPSVWTWIPEARVLGAAPASAVTRATVTTAQIPDGADLVEIAAQLSARVNKNTEDKRVHFALGGIDPKAWQTVEFTTLTELDNADAAEAIYTVLHISQPAVWS